jgi:hypothetical protein
VSSAILGWGAIVLAALSAWISIATGRVRFNAAWYVYRSQKPFIFWLAILAPIAIGILIVARGVV